MQALNVLMASRLSTNGFDRSNLDIIDMSEGLPVGQDGQHEVANCAICMEDIKGRAAVMPCGHIFDEECAVKWLETKNSCPICR